MATRASFTAKNVHTFHEQYGESFMLPLKERNDSWQNLLSGLGTARDKLTQSYLSPDGFLPLSYLEQLYIHDDIAARICDLLPNEMLRQSFSLAVKEQPYSWEGFAETLRDALVKSRLFGAAFIYVGADDKQVQEQPLVMSKIKGIRFLNVLTPKELSHHKFYEIGRA